MRAFRRASSTFDNPRHEQSPSMALDRRILRSSGNLPKLNGYMRKALTYMSLYLPRCPALLVPHRGGPADCCHKGQPRRSSAWHLARESCLFTTGSQYKWQSLRARPDHAHTLVHARPVSWCAGSVHGIRHATPLMRCCTISVPIPCVRRILGVGVCCLRTRLSTVSRHTCGLQICKHMSYSLAVHASLAATHARSKEARTPVVVVSAMAGSSSPMQRWSMGCKCAAQGGCRGCCKGIIALPARQLYGDTHLMSASARYIPPVRCLLRLSGAEGFYKRALLHECQANVAGASLCRRSLSIARARVA